MFKIVCFPTFQYSHKIGNTYSDICKICRILFFMMRTSLQAINHLHASNLGKKVTLRYPCIKGPLGKLAIYMSKEDGILSTHGKLCT